MIPILRSKLSLEIDGEMAETGYGVGEGIWKTHDPHTARIEWFNFIMLLTVHKSRYLAIFK